MKLWNISARRSDLRRSFLTELILSGDFDRITTDLMARLAARCAGQNRLQRRLRPKSGNSCIGTALIRHKGRIG